MITKFERKVIAGLTAFLMCLSMIFAVPVSVNAEAERTQDEAVDVYKRQRYLISCVILAMREYFLS